MPRGPKYSGQRVPTRRTFRRDPFGESPPKNARGFANLLERRVALKDRRTAVATVFATNVNGRGKQTVTRRPSPNPHRTGRRAGRARPVLVSTPNTYARPQGNSVRRQGGGEPRALALFILMLASIVLAFLVS